jgi:hypothetical protein
LQSAQYVVQISPRNLYNTDKLDVKTLARNLFKDISSRFDNLLPTEPL